MSLLEAACAAIPRPDRALGAAIQRRLDGKIGPRGSLGRLEELACTLGAIQGTAAPSVREKAVVIMAADHGVAEEGVSAFPQEVTAQRVRTVTAGSSAVGALARHAGARVVVADLGVKAPLPGLPGVRGRRVGPGTRNLARGPAMSRAEAVEALEAGIRLAGELADEGVQLLGAGEVGIANTTAASALTAALTGLPPEEAVGRGAGLDDAGLVRKVAVVARALAVNRPALADPLGALAAVGGFELAGLAGLALGAAARRVPVVLDGFIAGAAALAAVRLAPACGGALLASHRSTEPGHRAVLEALGKRPLLDLGLRLGEGTGAVLAFHLLEAAVRVLDETATFAVAAEGAAR